MRHFNLLDKVGTTLPYIETATNGHAAATAQNEQKNANSGKNGSSNGKCSLTGVILTAGLLIGQKAQCSNVLVIIGTAEETNKLIGLRKIDQLDIIVLARSANTKYLSTIRVENNSLDTVVIPRKSNGLDVFSRAQIHSWADHIIDWGIYQAGTAKRVNTKVSGIIGISVVDLSDCSWNTNKRFCGYILASYNLAKLKCLIPDFLFLEPAPVIEVLTCIVAALGLDFPFDTCDSRHPIVGRLAFWCDCWPVSAITSCVLC